MQLVCPVDVQHFASVLQYAFGDWSLQCHFPMNVGVGLTCAHMAFIVRRFEEMTGATVLVSAGSVCITSVSSWHTTGRATCQQSALQYVQQHIILYSKLSKGPLQGVKNLCQASQQSQQASDMRIMPWFVGGEYLPNMTSEAVAGMPTPALDLR